MTEAEKVMARFGGNAETTHQQDTTQQEGQQGQQSGTEEGQQQGAGEGQQAGAEGEGGEGQQGAGEGQQGQQGAGEGGEGQQGAGEGGEGQQGGSEGQEGASEGTPAPMKPYDQMNDAEKLEALKAITGRADVTSLEDFNKPVILTEAEIKEREKAEREEAIQYGMSEKIISSEDLEKYTRDKDKTPRQLTYELFSAHMLQENAEMSAEEIDQRFVEWNFEDLPEDDWRRVRKAKEMELLHGEFMKGTHGKVMSITDSYKQFNGMKAEALQYRQNILDGIAAVGDNFSASIKDEEQTPFPATVKFDPKLMEEVKNSFLDPKKFAQLQGKTKEEITSAINEAYIIKHLPLIINEAAKAYHADRALKLKAGRQGIIPDDHGTGGEINTAAAPGQSDKIIGQYAK